ncbi:MAG: four helix bundle protein [Patescibacteria group bacterium]
MADNEWKKSFLDRLLKFSVSVVNLSNQLPKTPAGFAIASQFIRSGTSIGANVEEAQDASSAKDFVQKLSIALREARETNYWLRIMQMTGMTSKEEISREILECGEIVAILTSSVKSSKKKIL